MSIKVRPISRVDRQIATGIVETFIPGRLSDSTVSKLKATVVDDDLFGVTPEHKVLRQFVYDDVYMRTAVIDLCSPVLNSFLAGLHKNVWSILLGIEGKEINAIANGEVAYNIVEDRTLTLAESDKKEIRNTIYSQDWLFGAQYLTYLLDKRFKGISDYCEGYEDATEDWKIDVDNHLRAEVYKVFVWPFLREYLGASVDDEVRFIGSIYERDYYEAEASGELDNWLIDNYFWSPDSTLPEELVEEIFESASTIASESIVGQFSNLAVLVAFRKDPTAVYNQIMDYVFVLPYGYRETIEGRVDPLTYQYNKLVKQNKVLHECMYGGQRSLYYVLRSYSNMVNTITTIFTGGTSKYLPESYKSLQEQLAGKNGLMRDRMQGVRMDYSGRAVITCDPNMSVDSIGVPKKMIPKLKEIGVIQSFKEERNFGNMTDLLTKKNLKAFNKRAIALAEGDYFLTGRQPTLWYLGVQGFKVVPVDGNSIVLSPLVVEPFNADFDGDQMHLESVITREAQEEVRTFMKSTDNLFYPRNGDLTVVVRHEIQYGLWIATKVKDDPRAKVWSAEELKELGVKLLGEKDGVNAGIMQIIFEGVCSQDIAIYDKVPLSKEYMCDSQTDPSRCPAGLAAVKFAIGPSNSAYAIGVLPLTRYDKMIPTKKEYPVDGLLKPKWLKALISANSAYQRTVFVDIINKVTKLGFAVVSIWPPSISAIVDIDVHDLIEEFNRKVVIREELLASGIDTEDSFTNYFNAEFKILDAAIKKKVVKDLGPDNGYVMLTESGAKGNKSNLAQIFGYKGRTQKNDVSSFNTIISASLSDQLTALEHFITAYGSRQGLADKVLATAEPGYLSRQLEHCAATARITIRDCGTTEGIVWTYDDIKPFIDAHRLTDNEVDNIIAIEEFFAKFLIGRNIIDANGKTVSVANENEAIEHFKRYVAKVDVVKREVTKLPGIKVRSPLFCKCPTCQTCYGKDPTTNSAFPKIGKPVGFVAAQAIGQPGTQLTMKNFQRGGVVSDANLTSSFEKISKYLELTDLRGNKAAKYLLPYDALSPADGGVICTSASNGRKRITVKGDDGKNYLSLTKLYVDKDTKIKKRVKRGENFQEVQGDLNILEVLKYRGYEEACKYLILMMYKIFNDETDVWAIHFEIMVSCMASYIITNSTEQFSLGTALSLYELRRYEAQGVRVNGKFTLMGLKTLPKFRSDFFESMIMEDMKTFVPRAIVINPVDEMKNPKTRISFGMDIGVGTAYKGEDWWND